MRQPSRKPVRLKCLVLGAAGAGKTSVLRRYFHQRFDVERLPTVGADFYTKHVPEQHVSFQCWDTPGRERMDPRKRTAASSSTNATTTTFRHDFFRQADAILLVYDVTSSTSFKQLLKWYADLLELQRKLPILVLGNKLDLTAGAPTLNRRRRQRVPSMYQRDVMGLHGTFRGHDFRYEYQVTPTPAWSLTSTSSSPLPNHTTSTKYDSKRRMEISSYLVNRENWTDDWSYLASVLNSEDQSNPDRDMVLLWCRRNGLEHCEASAATGEGVQQAMEALLLLALTHRQNESVTTTEQPLPQQQSRRHDTIDLQMRYAKEEKVCCCPRILRPVSNLLVLTRRDSA